MCEYRLNNPVSQCGYWVFCYLLREYLLPKLLPLPPLAVLPEFPECFTISFPGAEGVCDMDVMLNGNG